METADGVSTSYQAALQMEPGDGAFEAFMAQAVKPVTILAPSGPADSDAKSHKLAQLNAAKLVKGAEPFVWKNSGVARPAVMSWSIDYFHEHCEATAPFSVRSSPSTFIFSDERRNTGRFDVQPKVSVEDNSMPHFFTRFVEKSWEAGFVPFVPSQDAAAPGTQVPDGTKPVPLSSILHYHTLPQGTAAPATPPPALPRYGPGHHSLNPAPLPEFGASGSTERLYLQQVNLAGPFIGDARLLRSPLRATSL